MGKTKTKFAILILISLVVLILSVGIGSVMISPIEIFKIILYKIFNIDALGIPVESNVVILLKVRLPRVLLAFIVGSMLSVSGVISQSVLRNPLASSYTLGISSGAAVGASIAILFGFNFLGLMTLPFFGLSFGMLTVFCAVMLASKLDKNMGNITIILTGMAFSMFANAIIAFIMAFASETAQQITFWQLGSFSLKDWSHPLILLPIALLGIIFVSFLSTEMDIMTFGEEHSKASGVNVLKIKWLLLAVGAILTGSAVSMAGVIGFIDLFTPHIARRVFGSKHKLVIPASAIMGGVFMTLCDLIARTLTAPIELPVGAVTSVIGAPFFIYLYFKGRNGYKK